MVDYRINLAKSLTSTPEQRRRFYNGILMYLVLCAAALVGTSYLASVNVIEAYRAERQRRNLVSAMSSASKYSKTFYKDPQKAYEELNRFSQDLVLLREAFVQRTHFLPVLNQLFADFPEDIALDRLEASAEENTISFDLVGPGKSVRAQQVAWRQNEELGRLVNGVRQVKGEQRTIDGKPAYIANFECVLKK